MNRKNIEVAADLYRRCEMLQDVVDRRASLSATDLRGYLRIMREAYTALFNGIVDAGEHDKLMALFQNTK